jgi:hypothetical protein
MSNAKLTLPSTLFSLLGHRIGVSSGVFLRTTNAIPISAGEIPDHPAGMKEYLCQIED